MTPFERAADRWDANSRSRKAARARRARHAQLMTDIAHVLAEAHAVLATMPDAVVQTPRGSTSVTEIAEHAARLLHRLNGSRRKPMPVTTFELAACLEALLCDDGPCTEEARDEHPDAIVAARLLERWKGLGTTVAPFSEPQFPATTKETI